MKKILIGVLTITIIIGVGIPFVSGLVMENIVKKSHQDLNKMYADSSSQVSVEVMQYKRNFLSSEIEWKIKFGNLKSVYGLEEIIFLERANHRYSGIVSITSLEKNKWFDDFVKKKLDGKNPLNISTKYKLTGGIESTVSLDAFSLQLDQYLMEIGAGEAVTLIDKDLKNISSSVFWNGLSILDKIRIDTLSFDTGLEMISTYIWDGAASFAVKNMKIEDDGDKIEVVNLKGDYGLDFEKKENTLSLGAKYSVDAIRSEAQKIENASVRIGVKRLDAHGYEELLGLYAKTINNVLGDIIDAEDDPEKLKMIVDDQMGVVGFQMVAMFEKLFKKGLEVNVSDLYAKLPLGEIKGDVTLSLNKDMTFAQFIPIMSQPEILFGIFSLKSDVRLSEALVGDNPMLLSPISQGMQTGMFVKNGNNLEHKAETKDGKLFVNGLEVLLN